MASDFENCGAAESFLINARLQPGSSGETQLVIQVDVHQGYKLYADQFQVNGPAHVKIMPLSLPVPRPEKDIYSDDNKLFYDQSFTAVYLVEELLNDSLEVKISYQGCDQTKCFLPAVKQFRLHIGGEAELIKSGTDEAEQPKNTGSDWLNNIKQNYEIVAVQSGYINARNFLDFLDLSSKNNTRLNSIQKTWQVGKLWISVLLMILGGLALNLTPCVLPLIPVNLAIIGAGVRAASVRRGFLLGTVYGLGIVLAYGALGLVTVLTGTQFGALNASAWFNLTVALVFLALGLALLDVFMIDFSRFQSRFQLEGQGMFFILILGAVSALLAGACVAPVVIAVLLLAADLYAKGQMLALLMPFLLGIGMALPWPFAGAGLAFLPKPGKWMIRVKQAFAVVILLTAFYYAAMGARLLYHNFQSSSRRDLLAQPASEWLTFPEDLARVPAEKPILIYFWSSWCKSCKAMNHRTFQNAEVMQKMKDFACLKYQAENPEDDSTKRVLRHFGVLGLPSYVIMKHKR